MDLKEAKKKSGHFNDFFSIFFWPMTSHNLWGFVGSIMPRFEGKKTFNLVLSSLSQKSQSVTERYTENSAKRSKRRAVLVRKQVERKKEPTRGARLAFTDNPTYHRDLNCIVAIREKILDVVVLTYQYGFERGENINMGNDRDPCMVPHVTVYKLELFVLTENDCPLLWKKVSC